MIAAYKNLAKVERDFRSLKTDDLDLRPIYHRLDDRVRAHVLICMLAAYLTWHLRKALAPLTFTDEQPTRTRQPRRTSTPIHRRQHQSLPKNHHRHPPAHPQLPRTARPTWAPSPATRVRFRRHRQHRAHPCQPTDTQRRAFELLDATIPLTTTAVAKTTTHKQHESPAQPGDSPISAAVTSGYGTRCVDLLAPDVLVLQDNALAPTGADSTFILRKGELHAWAELPVFARDNIRSPRHCWLTRPPRDRKSF